MIVHGNLVGQRYIDHYLRTVVVKALLSNYNVLANVCRRMKYTETIKLCPLDVYVCQFQMYERISFKFSPNTL